MHAALYRFGYRPYRVWIKRGVRGPPPSFFSGNTQTLRSKVWLSMHAWKLVNLFTINWYWENAHDCCFLDFCVASLYHVGNGCANFGSVGIESCQIYCHDLCSTSKIGTYSSTSYISPSGKCTGPISTFSRLIVKPRKFNQWHKSTDASLVARARDYAHSLKV